MSWTFKPVFLLMSGRALGFGVSFLIPIVLVRTFDLAEFGTYKQLFLVYSTLYVLAQLGMAESLFYFLPKAPQKASRYVLNSILILTGSGLVFALLLQMSGGALFEFMRNDRLEAHLPWIGFYLFLMTASALLEITLTSRKRYLGASVSYAVSDTARTAALLFPVLVWGELRWLLLGAIAFASLRFFITVLYLRREFRVDLRPDTGLMKEQLVYALPFQMAVLIEILQLNFHHYAVSYYFDPAVFAIYSVGCLQIPLADLASSSSGNVLMVGMGEALQQNDRRIILTVWHDTTRKLALLFFPLITLILVTAPELILLVFTETYLASVPIFLVWVAFLSLSVLQTDALLRVYAETRFLVALYTLRFVLVAVFIHGFITAWGLLGAVFSTTLAALVAKIVALVKAKSLMKVDFGQLLPWRGLAQISGTAAAAGLVALVVKLELQFSTVAVLTVTGLTYLGLYAGLLLALGVLSRDERLLLKTGLRRVVLGLPKGRRVEGKFEV